MTLRTWILAAFFAAAWGSACAFPAIEFVSSNDDDAAGAGMVGGNGGNGGAGGEVGGFGGAKDCVIGETGVCAGDEKCSVLSPQTGEIGCVPAGNQAVWTRCFADSDCQNGHWCDVITSTCHPVCESSAECTEVGANCVPARSTPTVDIPPGTFRICTPNCHPQTGLPCDPANGPVSCYYDVSLSLWECTDTEAQTAGQMCMGNDVCGVGMACPTSNTCRYWCNNPNDWCQVLVSLCIPTNPVVTHNGLPYGLCD